METGSAGEFLREVLVHNFIRALVHPLVHACLEGHQGAQNASFSQLVLVAMETDDEHHLQDGQHCIYVVALQVL